MKYDKNSLNRVTLVGRLGCDPDIKDKDSGLKICNFLLVTNMEGKNDDGGKELETQWHDCVAFGNMAYILENHVKKGDKVLVEGRLKYYVREDSEGNKNKKSEIQLNRLLILDKKENKKIINKEVKNDEVEDKEEDDLPF